MARTLVTGNILRSGSIPTTALPTGTITSSVQLANTLPVGTVSSSTQVDYSQLQNISTDIVSSSTQVTAFLPIGTVSSSTQLPSGIASSSAQVKDYLPTDTVSSSAQVTTFLPAGTVSSSNQVDFNTISNKPTLVSQSSQVDVRDTTGITTIATTGSNTFTGVTTISDTTNSTNYLDGALTVAGGMSVQKDMRISGSMTINGLLTVVSMSSQYVTSSQYNLGVSKVTVNDDDNVRFAGLSVFDSGSSSPTTASIYWDSLNHKFLYENLSGSAYNSAILIAGPKNTGSLGQEQGLTSGYIPYATGDDHIDNSVMYQNGSNIGIGITNPLTTLQVQGNVSASSFTGSLSGTVATAAQTNITSVGTLSSLTVSGDLTVDTSTLKVSSTNDRVGIGTASPSAKLHVYYNSNSDSRLLVENISTGSSAVANVQLQSDAAGGGIAVTSNAFTTSDLIIGDAVYLYASATAANGLRINTETTSPIIFGTNNTERVRIDLSGNVGVGTIPTGSWGSQGKALQIGSQGAFAGYSYTSTNNQVWIGNNVYVAENTGFYYIASNPAAQLRLLNDGSFQFNQAPSGTAGNALTFTSSVVLNSSGNLGIGTTNPSNKLQVVGNIQFGNNSAYTDLVLGTDTALSGYNQTNYITPNTIPGGGTALTALRLKSAISGPGTNRLDLIVDGNVGINQTSPGAPLEVRVNRTSSTNATVMILSDNVTGAQTNGVYKALRAASNNGNSVSEIRFIETDGTNNNTAIAFATAPTAGGLTERMRINPVGNVGIGITTPSMKLSLGSDVGRKFMVYDDGGGANEIGGGMGVDLGGFSAETSIFFGNYSGNGRLSIGAWTSSQTYSTKVTVLANGNVGINTTNPTGLLHIAAAHGGGADIWMGFENTSGGGYGDWTIGKVGNNDLTFFSNTGGLATTNPRITFDYDGNVGIGKTNPEGTLDAYGTGYFGFQDYRTQAIQKVLVLRGEPVSGIYAQSRFNFYTTPGTTVDGVAKLTIKSQYGSEAESGTLFTLTGDGYLRLAGKGIQFNGDTSDANSLDDYEEGTWTPALFDGSSDRGPSYAFRSATYTKIGRLVFVRWGIKLSSKGTSTGSGEIQIRNLPFSCATTGAYQEPNVSVATGLLNTAANAYSARMVVLSGGAHLFGRVTSANADTTWTYNDLTNDSWIIGEIFYEV